MNRILFLFLAALVSCQTSKKALTMQEANLRADAAIRHGIITKDQRESAIAEVLIKNAPLTATTAKEKARLDPQVIEKRAAQTAAQFEPYTTWSRQYNQGKISRHRLELCAQEDYRNQQILAMKRARGAAISAAIAQGIAASSVPTYRPPAFLRVGGFDSGINRYDPNSLSNLYRASSSYKVVKIDPNALQGSAYTSLGSLYYQVPRWPVGFGDDEKAEELLKQGLALNSDGIDSNYFYGDYLIEQDRYEEAVKVLEHAAAAAPRPGRELADEGRQKEIAAKLALAKAEL